MKMFSYLFLLVHFVLIACAKQRYIAAVDRFEEISKEKNEIFVVENIGYTFNDTYGSLLNIEGELLRDVVSSKLKINMEIIRCANKEALDTCEYFAKLVPPNACMFLNMKGMAWSTIVNHIEPRLNCPFKKGKYIGREMSFNPALFSVFSLYEWYWKMNFRMYEGDTCLVALVTENRYIPARKNK